MISNQKNMDANGHHKALTTILRKACKKIAPVWPLENFVAVNPYLGLADLPFEQAADRLAKVGGIEMTLPISFYLNALEEGKLKKTDIEAVLYKKGYFEGAENFIGNLKKMMNENENLHPKAQSLTDVASGLTGQDWNRFVTDRITSWAAAYFDEGQTLWNSTDQKQGIFSAWHKEALTDRTPEIMGLSGFRKAAQVLPEQPIDAAWYSLQLLGIPEEALEIYLHRVLMRIGGWAAYAARLDWDNELHGGQDGALMEFLCVLICWEACLYQCLKNAELQANWIDVCEALAVLNAEDNLSDLLSQKLILQEAYDLAGQRAVIEKFSTKTEGTANRAKRPKVQAIFCIDVRSEVFRRNLERVTPEVSTLGFAGFFAFPIKYVPIGHEEGQAQCPVLLPTGPVVKEEITDELQHAIALKSRKLKHQVNRVWKSFKLGAISCFSFVGPVGLAYLPKLFTDAFGLTRPVPHPDREGIKSAVYQHKSISLEIGKHGYQATGIPLEEQVKLAKSALQAMSLTDGFARLVLIVGHGSTTVNNPYATGLDCGACGGHTGEANARVAAAVLNNKTVREHLQNEAIIIPDDTFFLACQHDTTTDEVSLFNTSEIPHTHQNELTNLKQWLCQAGQAARAERALRMQIEKSNKVDAAIMARSKDWAQVRPEWGLAGCSAFIVAPRSRTQGLDLKGRSFLHSYEWKKDRGFKVLELIMTAPMVVTSWISLQYYASTVDNMHYGSGNKTLHNVTGGIGVLEGYAGDLRVGLPWQSVHDGKQYQHEPLKLNVIIEAPPEAMNIILEKHSSVRNLCDNGWIHLLAMDEEGRVSYRYAGNLRWEEVEMALVA